MVGDKGRQVVHHSEALDCLAALKEERKSVQLVHVLVDDQRLDVRR
jgi:hypothetical protein